MSSRFNGALPSSARARHEQRFDENVVVTVSDFRASGAWEAEQAAWPGPHKPGMIIGGYKPEDEADLALLA